MALTPSHMLPLGTPAPDFSLPEPLTSDLHTPKSLRRTHGLLVAFICNHCSYVKHINPELARVAEYALSQQVGVALISSNDVDAYPADGPLQMARQAPAYPAPYLYDETQAVAKAYQAACTPDFFLFDGALELVYRGRLDGATPGNNVPLTGEDLRAAIAALVAGAPITGEQKPSMGCNIKWR